MATAHPRQDTCLHTLFEQRAAAAPDAVAIDHPEGTLTYGRLNTSVAELAHELRRAGVRPETTVGVRLPHGPALVTALLAVLKAGGAYVPLDPALPEERQRFLLDDTGALFVLSGQTRVAGDHEPSGPEPTAENAAYVIHTSGTTGRPKGVLVPHRGVVNRVLDTLARHRVGPGDRVLLRTSVGFDAAAWEIFVPLLAGATLVVGAGDTGRDLSALLRTITERGVTVLQAVPSVLRMLTPEDSTTCPSVRLLYSAGEQLDAATADRVAKVFGAAELWNVYGPTECSIGCVEGRYVPGADGPVPIGTPIAGTTLAVLDAHGDPVPDGEPGELHVGGVGVARGYLGRPAETAARFLPDPGGPPGARVYRTGDLVRRLPDGRLAFLGRVDQELKVRGVRIEPGEVEAVLLRHPSVRAAAVAAHDNRLIAYLVGEQRPTAGLREFLRGLLPAEYVPTHLTWLPELPVTHTGKLDRAALPRPETTTGRRAPRGPAEELVSQVWREVLGVPEVAADDDFFQLGGHSLLVPRLAARLNRATGATVPMAALYAAATVTAQARLLTGGHDDGPPPLPVSREQDLPLSPGQRRLWFLDRLEPGSREYLVPIVLTLPAHPDPALVTEAVRALVRRHEILRTRYAIGRTEPHQIVDADPVITLSRPGGELEEVLRAETATGFDLAAGPVWRAALVGQELLLVVHHIACDGQSVAVLRRDFAELYAALAAGRTPVLPELPVQYADFAAWQNRRLDEGALDAQTEYWRDRLAGLPTLELPADRPRPVRRDGRGGVHVFTVDAELARAVADLGRREGATPFMTFLAAYCCLLARFCGSTDIVLGTPVAGRGVPEVDELAGFFVNMLVLRCDLAGATRFTDALAVARDTALGAFAHQDVPFEQLVEELQPERDLARSPLFQAMFELVDEGFAGPGGGARAVLDAWDVAKFDLTLALERHHDGTVTGVLEYATDLFDAATVRRLAETYVRVLDQVVREVPLAELDVLEPGERHRILTEWNDTATPYPDVCVHELVEAQVRRTPDAVAAEFGDQRLTYAELDARANALAWRLRGLGVGPDVRVGVLLDRSLELLVGLLGVLKAGGAYVPLETAFPPARVGALLGHVGAHVCLAAEGTTLPEGITPVVVGDERSPRPPSTGVTPDHLVAVYYTSGSTGTPKGVAAPHRGWVSRLLDMQDHLRLAPGEAVLQKTTVIFDDTPVECFWPLFAGGRVVLLPPGEHRDPVAILNALAAHEVAVVLFVPSMLKLVLEAVTPRRRAGLRALRHLGTSGEPLSADLTRLFLDRFGTDGPLLHNHWGVTEVSIDSTHHLAGPADADGPGIVTIGRPIANNQVYVLDADLRPVPPGVRGEIHIGGLGLARGYHNSPAATALAFLPDPFGRGGRIYRTGDHGRLRADGRIEFLGRTDHQVKIRGVRVELGEVQEVLRAHPGVRDAAVDVWEAASADTRLVAYLVLREDTTVAQVRRYLEQWMPGYLVPSVLTPVPEVRRLPSGKLDRAALGVPDTEGLVRAEGIVEPRTPTEQALAEVWREFLGTRVGIHNSFFHAGGYSLLAAQVIARIQERFGLEVPLSTMFDKPTIAQLAEVVEEMVRAEVERLTDDEVRAAAAWGQENQG